MHRERAKLGNRLLLGLVPEELRRLRPYLEPVRLVVHKVLFEANQPLTRVYFIEAGVISMVSVFEDGTTAEMATVGREGVVPVGSLFGGKTALGYCVVQVQGSALAMDSARFSTALAESPKLRAACGAYAQAFFAQLLQNVACNAAHTVEERCARWLLTSHDRSGDTFPLTHEVLAEMLGVRRSTVTLVARAFQNAGLIQYRRGILSVLDRAGLEAAACECYRVIRNRYEQLLPCAFD
jgi:CRP-like cAMP-binding protein